MRVCLSLVAPATSHSRNSAKKNKLFSSRFGVLQAAQGKSPFVPAGPTRTEKTIFPSTLRQAFNCTHTSQEWHLTRQLRPSGLHQVRQKSVGKSVGLNLNDTIGYHKVWVCFSKMKRVWKTSRPRTKKYYPNRGKSHSATSSRCFWTTCWTGQKTKAYRPHGAYLALGLSKLKVVGCTFFFSQPTTKVSFMNSMVPTSPHGYRRL